MKYHKAVGEGFVPLLAAEAEEVLVSQIRRSIVVEGIHHICHFHIFPVRVVVVGLADGSGIIGDNPDIAQMVRKIPLVNRHRCLRINISSFQQNTVQNSVPEDIIAGVLEFPDSLLTYGVYRIQWSFKSEECLISAKTLLRGTTTMKVESQ